MSIEATKQALEELEHIKAWCLRSLGMGLVNENVLASLRQAIAETEKQEPVAWKSLEKFPPPIDQALDDASVSSRRRVLVTNNINATNRMGQPSHVWFVSPQRVKKGEWVGFTDSMNKVEALTHWFDPFDTHPQPKVEQEPMAMESIIADLVKEEIRYYHDGHYIDSSDAKYQLLSFAHRVAKAAINTHPQPKIEQEPVCPHIDEPQGCYRVRCQLGDKCADAQPKREWVALTDEEKRECLFSKSGLVMDYEDVVDAVEAKLKEKNT